MSDQIVINQTPINNNITVANGYVISVNGKYGVVVLDPFDIGLDSITALSGTWNSTFSSVNALSSVWNSVFSSVKSTSGKWNTAYNYVITNSGIELNQEQVAAFVNSNSANIISVNTLVNYTSADWDSVFSSVNSASASWDTGSGFQSQSANNNSVFSSVNALSADWNSAYASTTALNLSSVYWNTAYNNAIYSINGTANQIVATPTGNNNGNNSYNLSLPNSVNITTLNVLSTLNVAGSANFYYTSNLNVSSSIIYFGEGNTGNALDLGIVAHFVGNLNNGNSSYQHTGFVRQAGQNSPGTWTLFSGLTTEPGSVNSGINWSDPYFQVDTLKADVLGNLSGKYVTVGNGTSDQWNNVYSLINKTTATTFNVSSLSATSNINVNGNLALNNFNSKLYFAGNYLQGNGNTIIVGAYGMGFRAQGGLANSLLLATDGVIGFGNDVSYWYTNNQRVGLTYDGPATFAQKDFNNSQTYRLYNTYTDVNNYERGAITFSKPTSAFTLSVESAGTGVNRDFWINTAGTPKLVVTSGGNVGIGTINPNQTLSVFGNISSSGLIYDQIGNSNQWNTAYNTATSYSSVSSSFATNTTVNTLTGLLTPLTTTRTLTGLLVKTTDLNTLSATLLTRTDFNTASSLLTPLINTELVSLSTQSLSSNLVTVPDNIFSKLQILTNTQTISSGLALLSSTNLFTTVGLQTWVCPNDVTTITVECWGGGGAGGSAVFATAGSTLGGGGAGGSYAIKNTYSVTPDTTYYLNVGAGGVPTTTNTPPITSGTFSTPGGDSWFGTSTTPDIVLAKGGQSGKNASSNNAALGGGVPQAGSFGDTFYTGGSGSQGSSAVGWAGGGGGGAGSTGMGNTPANATGLGGTATASFGGAGGISNPKGTNAVGGNGLNYGGGGGGARSSSSNPAFFAGGTGAQGLVKITYNPVETVITQVSTNTLIPAGSICYGVVAKVISTGNTTIPQFNLGDGNSATQYATNISTALGTKTNSTNFSYTAPPFYTSPPTIYISGTNYSGSQTFNNEVWQVTAYYLNILSF